MGRRALVTGISGFAGGFLAEHLLACGDQVLGTSPNGALLPDSAEVLRDLPAPVAWALGRPDGLSPEARSRIESFAPEAIYHLAAISIPDDCDDTAPGNPARAVNVEGTRQTLQLATDLASKPRVLFVSTAHVYAPVDPDHPRVVEDAPLGPIWPYGRTKLAAEQEVRRAVEQLGCDALIVRAFQHTGPRQIPRLMLPQWLRQVARQSDAPIEIYTRDAWLDLSDVRDVVRAYRLLVEQGRSGEVYNVGTGVSRRTGDILEQVVAISGTDRPVIETRPGFKQETIADPTRLVERTGWQPEIPLEQTIVDTLAYWRNRGATGSK